MLSWQSRSGVCSLGGRVCKILVILSARSWLLVCCSIFQNAGHIVGDPLAMTTLGILKDRPVFVATCTQYIKCVVPYITIMYFAEIILTGSVLFRSGRSQAVIVDFVYFFRVTSLTLNCKEKRIQYQHASRCDEMVDVV